MKGALINSGSIDIKETMVEERLCLKLPDNFKWLSAKVIDATTGSKANLEIVNNRIFINLGLFRKNEFIRFEALADIPSDNKDNLPTTIIFKDKLSFEHRIADTDKVEKRESKLELPSFKNMLGAFYLVYFLMVLFATIWIIFFPPDIRRDYAEFNYQLKYDSAVKIVKATPHLNGTVDLLSLQGKDISTIKIAEFNSRLQKIETNDFKTDGWLSNFVKKNIQTVLTIYFIVMLFITSTVVLSRIVEYRKLKKLRYSLNLDKENK